MTTQVMMDCDNCGKKTMHIQPSTSHLLHLFLSVITFGFWLVVWFIIALNNKNQGHCVACGREVGVLGSTRGGNKVTKPTPETHVKCPDCRELVLRDARVCKHCGCKLISQ
jgi:DNA-directed RNA polymerase subunit RPC12/RpoP